MIQAILLLGYKFDEEKYFDKVHNIHIKDRKIKGSTVRLAREI